MRDGKELKPCLSGRGVTKVFGFGDAKTVAVDHVDFDFHEGEFVSIVGESGSGKTTLSKMLLGLISVTEGEIDFQGKPRDISNGKKKKEYWKGIQAIFQDPFASYNMFKRVDSVLLDCINMRGDKNLPKEEKERLMTEACSFVNLKYAELTNKYPFELSGGQMQRLMIARIFLLKPKILLADEPTGALDSDTSIQVMDLLQEVAKERLVVMVTHNPELAEQYSSRIIRVLDGKLTDDSRPLTEEEYQRELQADKAENENGKKLKKPSMSFGTSFSLSLKNLFTKKGRTMLTSFAGSIGIIGIALVLSISQGFNTYINTIQEETLSSYPLTIQKTNTDLSALMETFMGYATSDSTHSNDAVSKKSAIYDMMDALNNMETSENDLKSFKSYIESKRKDSESNLHRAVNGVQYSYDLDMLIYTKNVDGTIIHSDTEELMQEMVLEHMGIDMQAMTDASTSMFGEDATSMMSMGMGGSSMNLWQELLPGDNGKPINDLLKKQYDVVYGSWPNSYDEIVLVLDENNELDDMTLYALGLEPKEDVDSIMEAAVNGKELQKDNKSWSYADICSMDFRTILNSDCYRYDESTGLYTDLRDTEAGLQYLYDNGLKLKVTGIIRPNEDTTAPMLSGSIAYTSDLTKYIIEHSKESDAITAQKDSKNTDIFTGLPFKDTSGSTSDADKQTAFLEYLNELDDGGKAQAYVQIMSIPTEEQLNDSVQQAMQLADSMQGMSRSDMEAAMLQGMTQQMSMSESDVQSYLESMSDDEITDTFTQMMQPQVKAQYAQQVQQKMAAMQPAELVGALNQLLPDHGTVCELL
mgnify:CR=1 FL=1